MRVHLIFKNALFNFCFNFHRAAAPGTSTTWAEARMLPITGALRARRDGRNASAPAVTSFEVAVGAAPSRVDVRRSPGHATIIGVPTSLASRHDPVAGVAGQIIACQEICLRSAVQSI